METKYVRTLLFSLLLFWACGKDEDPQIPKNSTPLIAGHAFVAHENLPDTQIIGTLKAIDADGDELSFSISENDNGLFEITKAGALSLATGKKLDYEDNARHNITVQVTDGTDVASVEITIDVIPVDPENLSPIVEAQTFSVPEDISDSETIGTVEASDPEDDNLIFALIGSSEGLFEMNEIGEISLVEGKFLDFETEQEQIVNVLVGDGNTFVQVAITINVLDVNPPPTGENQNFEVNEDIPDTDIIGTVLASDPENEVLTFSIAEDLDGLFEISDDGEISLREGKNLDFEGKTEHQIVIGVSDNVNDTVFFELTIDVINVIETPFEDPTTFIIQWQVANGQQLTIGTNVDFAYEYSIDWGDGTIQELTQQNPSHLYTDGGIYTVVIKGTFPAIRMQAVAQSNRDALVDVLKWGNNEWQSMREAFYGCNSLTAFTASDNPDLSQVSDMSRMFMIASNLNSDIGNWNTSNVTNMAEMFRAASSFNQDIGSWETGNVTFMNNMFFQATNFDQNLGNWDIGSINGLFNIFHSAGLSPTNYSATLRGWAALGNIPDGQNMGTEVSADYCNDQETLNARDFLDIDKGWTINDGVEVNCP